MDKNNRPFHLLTRRTNGTLIDISGTDTLTARVTIEGRTWQGTAPDIEAALGLVERIVGDHLETGDLT